MKALVFEDYKAAEKELANMSKIGIDIPTYFVIKGSYSAHCCFEGSVMQRIFDKKSDGLTPTTWHQFCETFYFEDAISICDAMNAISKKKKS